MLYLGGQKGDFQMLPKGSETLPVFEGDIADNCTEKCPLILMGAELLF